MPPPTAHAFPRPIRGLLRRTSVPLNSEVRASRQGARAMASLPAVQLWDPSRGIRFAEKTTRDKVVYPTIDYSKFYSTVAAGEGVQAEAVPSVEDVFASQGPVVGVSAEAAVPEPPEPPSSTVKPDPPSTSLDFNISEKAFRDAQEAAEGSPASFWSYAMYRGPVENGAEQRVKVHYCKSHQTAERACQHFLNEKVIGFDLEWSPEANRFQGPRRNVSLIQIASPSRIALFHVALFPSKDELVPPSFKKIMENSEIAKVGVAIKADCTRLKNYLGVDTKGIFELCHLYKLVKYSGSGQPKLVNKRLVPLAQLAEEYLHLPLYKGDSVRGSDWSQALDMGQIIYSASDAYAGLQIYHLLEKEREAMDPCPPRPSYAELNLPIRLADGATESSTDEGAEMAEDEPEAGGASVTPLPASLAEAVQESLQVDPENDANDAEPAGAKVTAKKQVKSPARTTKASATKQQDSRVAAADSWVAEYCANKKKVVAPTRTIRAYHIWHENSTLDPEAVAKLLREPPLKTNTVVGYILEAIRCEKLPFEKPRLRDEILNFLPKEALQGKYKRLAQAVAEEG